eukprot:SAG22_NODE_2968_length_2039_cov_1.675662_1_plen_91_part_10
MSIAFALQRQPGSVHRANGAGVGAEQKIEPAPLRRVRAWQPRVVAPAERLVDGWDLVRCVPVPVQHRIVGADHDIHQVGLGLSSLVFAHRW